MKEQVTISLEPAALRIARAEVEAGEAPSLSAVVERALRSRGRSQVLREAVSLWEVEHGPIGAEAREWARSELARAFS